MWIQISKVLELLSGRKINFYGKQISLAMSFHIFYPIDLNYLPTSVLCVPPFIQLSPLILPRFHYILTKSHFSAMGDLEKGHVLLIKWTQAKSWAGKEYSFCPDFRCDKEYKDIKDTKTLACLSSLSRNLPE